MTHTLGYLIHRMNDRLHTPGKPTLRYRVVDRLATWLYAR